MARRLRYVPPGGALFEITCRTVQGRLLLRPSALLIEITLGILARAARLFGVAVHAYAFLSNHYHLLVSVSDVQRLASFMNYLNSNLAREAGRLVRWREKFWGKRYQAILVSGEEAAQVGRLSYLLAHGVKEGLVASPYNWPGAHCARALAEGTTVTGRWRNRTLESRSQRNGLPQDPEAFIEHEELTLAPLPCWQELEPEVYRARIREMIEGIELDGRQREEETGMPPLGCDAVCRQDPHHEPNQIKKAPAPLVHAVALEVRRALRRAYLSFVAAYRRAAGLLRTGAKEIEFPEGAFLPPLLARFACRSG
jgi:REP element-mobilizing transposase RayT